MFTDKQRELFYFLHNKILNEEPQFLILNAEAGTGKSTLLEGFNLSMDLKVYVIYSAYSKILQIRAKQSSMCNVECYTNFQMIKRMLLLSYKQTIEFLQNMNKIESLPVLLYELLNRIKKIRSTTNNDEAILKCKILMIDEYTVCSFVEILFIFIYCKYYKVHLILIGDRAQKSSITKSIFWHGNIYDLCVNVLQMTVCNPLTEQMRIEDENYRNVLNSFVDKMFINKYFFEIPMSFESVYFLYEHFENCFFKPFKGSVFYIAPEHRQIKKFHFQDFQNKEKENPTNVGLSFFEDSRKNIIHYPKTDKFLPALPIIKNRKYLTFYNETVTVKDFKKNNTNIELVILEDDSKLEKQCVDESSGLNTELKKWLIMHAQKKRSYEESDSTHILQIPLKLFSSTMCGIQGITLKYPIEIHIVLDGFSISCNEIYVSLSRITSLNQLYAITCNTYLNDLILTKYKNDDYYYKLSRWNFPWAKNVLKCMISKNKSNIIDKINFIEIDDPVIFQTKSNFFKILKKNYHLKFIQKIETIKVSIETTNILCNFCKNFNQLLELSNKNFIDNFSI